MAKSWQELKKELEEATRKIMTTCPDEIKRFYYGTITYSEAGKYNLNQYFGHFVEAYDFYSTYSIFILASVLSLATDPEFELKHVKKMFSDMSAGGVATFLEHGGQKTLAKYLDEMLTALDTVQTKEEFVQLVKAFKAYVTRCYTWIHWYFPWGLGPPSFQRRSPEYLKEMIRLSQTS